MFSCGNYPAFPEIRESIKAECEANLTRLRHHPSIVIYAGNNEDYQVQEQFHLTYRYEDKDPESWLTTDFPARYIYEKVCQQIKSAAPKFTPSLVASRGDEGQMSTRRVPPRISMGRRTSDIELNPGGHASMER